MVPNAVVPTSMNMIIRSDSSPMIRGNEKNMPEITIKEIPITVSIFVFSFNPIVVCVSNLTFAYFIEPKPDNHTRDFCCEKLEKYASIQKSWNTMIVKFCIIKKDNFIQADYCFFVVKK